MMSTILAFPDQILQKLICQECLLYLSVGPISITKQRKIVCGRCHGSDEIQYTPSMLTHVMEKSRFKCINYLNGCDVMLLFHEVEDHETTCSRQFEACPFCSYKGNLLQIYNHSKLYHSENVLDANGRFTFSLEEDQFKKSMLYIYKDVLFLINAEIVDDLFEVNLLHLNQSFDSNMHQFEVNIWKKERNLNDTLELREFAWFYDTSYRIRKNRYQLNAYFGQDAMVTCQIIIGQITFALKEIEAERKFVQVKQKEDNLNVAILDLVKQGETYAEIINILKKMLLFFCVKCKAFYGVTFYFCRQLHCYCEICLQTNCELCNHHTTFERLEQLERTRVKCEWVNCNQQICFVDYLKHKIICLFRPYKCPLKDCLDILYSVNRFIKHWHVKNPQLVIEKDIYCELYDIVNYYWIIDNDVYFVSVEWGETELKLLVQEVNVALSKASFECLFMSGEALQGKTDLAPFLGNFQANLRTAYEQVWLENFWYYADTIRIKTCSVDRGKFPHLTNKCRNVLDFVKFE